MVATMSRRTWLLGAVSLAGAASGCAGGIYGVARERNAVRLDKVQLRFAMGRYDISIDERFSAVATMLNDGSFHRDATHAIIKNLAVHEITHSVPAPYTLTVTPGKYVVTTNVVSREKTRALALTVKLSREGEATPIWEGGGTVFLLEQYAPLLGTRMGYWMQSVLNRMARDGVIALPAGRANR